MKLYCLDIIAIVFTVLVGGVVTTNAVSENIQEEKLYSEGYVKVDNTYEELAYSNYQECIEYNDKFYCN